MPRTESSVSNSYDTFLRLRRTRGLSPLLTDREAEAPVVVIGLSRIGFRMRVPGIAILIIAMGLALSGSSVHADQYAKYNNEGNRLAAEGRHAEALSQYHSARVERPGAPEVEYNIGNVYHEMGDYDTALAAYQSTLGLLDGPLLPDTYYNMGNTLYRGESYEDAIEAYKRTLIEHPDDRDAKFNLELALRQIAADSSQQEQDQDGQPDSTGEQDEQNQEQNQNQDQADSTRQQEQDGEQDQSEDQQQDGDEQNQPQEQADQQAANQPPPQGMTREDAERLLDALKQDETDLQKQRAQRMVTPVPVAEDW